VIVSKRTKTNKRTRKLLDGTPHFLKVGDFVFLVGDQVLKKYKCIEKTPSGFRFQDLYTEERFVYRTPTPYFRSGMPLFKNGLSCYPAGHEGLEIRWTKNIITNETQASIAELVALHGKMNKRSEVEIFFVNIIIQVATEAILALDFKKIVYEEEFWYKDALGRIFTFWRKEFPDFGGLIGAMDRTGLFVKDFLELNVERKARRGLSDFEVHSIKRRTKELVEKALSRKSKG